MKVTQNLKIDLARRTIVPLIDAVQGDSARWLEIELLSDGKSWEIPADAQVMVRYCNTAGGGGTYDALEDGTSAWSAAFNRLTVAVAPAVCAVSGDTQLQVTLTRGGVQISTFAVIVRVQRAAVAVQENGDYTNLGTWLDSQKGYLPEGGTVGQVLTIGPDLAPIWADPAILADAEGVSF